MSARRALGAGILALALALIPTASLAIGADSGGGSTPPSAPTSPPTGNGTIGADGGLKPQTGITTRTETKKYPFEPGATLPGNANWHAVASACETDGGDGYSVKYSYEYDWDARKIVANSRKIVAIGCLMPTVTTTQVTCIIGSTASVDMVTPASRRLGEASDLSAWGRGERTPASCRDSRSWAAINAVPTDFGRYEARASTQVQTATIVRKVNALTGAVTEEVGNVGAPYSTAQMKAQGQLTCAGWEDGWVGAPSWTLTDCGPNQTTNTPQYQCVASGPETTVNGEITRDATIFRSGESNSIGFQQFVPVGNFTATGTATTRVIRSGSPWNLSGRAGSMTAQQNDVGIYIPGTNNSLFNSNDGTVWNKGTITAFDFRAYWAGNANDPTVLRPQWNIGGESTVEGIRIVGFDGEKFITERTSTTVSSTAQCLGEPVSINIVRATSVGVS